MSRHLMVCISGWAGTGKDECSGRLVKIHSAIHTGLADPGKRHGLDVYGFTEEQLWGPSKFRNAGDPRYPKPILKEFDFQDNGDGTWTATVDAGNRDAIFMKGKSWMGPGLAFMNAATEFDVTGKPQCITVKNTDPAWFLSPREFLQLYMELCNTLYADTWIDKGIADHRLLAAGTHVYTKVGGIKKSYPTPHMNPRNIIVVTCFSDFRHIHEHRKARASADASLVPVLIRIKRPTVLNPPFRHRSETEQTRIRDAAYDFVIDNSGSLSDLYSTVDQIIKTCSDPKWQGKSWSEDFVLANESCEYSP